MTTGNKWQRHTVSDLIAGDVLFVGDGYRAKLEELSDVGLPFARAGNIDGGFHFEDADHFPEENLARVGNKVSAPGDVVFTSKGTVGRFALVRDATPRFVYSPQLCFWRVLNRDRIDSRFLYYWMSSREFYSQFKGVAGQTDMAEYVSLGDQRRMYITLPEIDQQKRIASVLGALDNKINLNRNMNETLEAIARAIFRSWFLHSDPLAGSPQDSDSWHHEPLTEAFEINPVRKLEKGTIARYVDMANTPTSSARVVDCVNREFTSGMRFINGDTLVARITPCLENGKTAFVDFLKDGEVAWGSTEFIVLRPKPPLPPEYGYFLARTEEFRSFAISNMSGTSGRQRVPADCFQHFQIAVPPEPIAAKFGNLARPFFAKMKSNDEESQTLAELRDTLLPKLISGEIRIKQAEQMIEAHA